ncbi:hypothetical protein AAG747_26425 [Rapidithrix thailandica]|uniref:DUF4374 domain-containing protein n=1 Tax=Rapidithrix thailandica TaxID=413964 RepID=A0AAW9SL58_9BACT
MKKHISFLTGYLPVFLLTLIGLTACEDDKTTPTPPQETESAIIASLRVSTPSGRVYYMGAYAELPEKLDFKEMEELGASVTVYSYGENPYVWNGTASTLTKYVVDNQLKISAGDVLSFANTGLSGFFGPPAFFSETQAYFFALAEGKIIEFDPDKMTITKTIDVTPLEHSGDPDIKTSVYASYVTSTGKIILPVAANPGDFDKFPQYAQIAVFDPANHSITYVKDDRMSMGYDTFAKGNDGALYYRPARNTARAEDYTTLTDFPTTGGLLKVNPDGTFDPAFFVDLKAILNAHSVNIVTYVHGGKALTQYMDASHVPPSNPSDWLKAPTKFALVDLEAQTFEEFTAFEEYGTVYRIGEIDGIEYYGNFGASSGDYSLLRQDGAKEFKVVSTPVGGSIGYIGKLR